MWDRYVIHQKFVWNIFLNNSLQKIKFVQKERNNNFNLDMCFSMRLCDCKYFCVL